MESLRERCPKCGEPATVIIHGLPDPEAIDRLVREGVDYELAGCMVSPYDPDWRCRSCGHEWRDA